MLPPIRNAGELLGQVSAKAAAETGLRAGTPVVISDQVNIWQEVKSSGGGEVTQVDEGQVARAISSWMQDASRRRAAGEAGRAFALERYDWRRIAERCLGHYQRMIDTATGRNRTGRDPLTA